MGYCSNKQTGIPFFLFIGRHNEKSIFYQMILDNVKIINIHGKKGSGKSYFANNILSIYNRVFHSINFEIIYLESEKFKSKGDFLGFFLDQAIPEGNNPENPEKSFIQYVSQKAETSPYILILDDWDIQDESVIELIRQTSRIHNVYFILLSIKKLSFCENTLMIKPLQQEYLSIILSLFMENENQKKRVLKFYQYNKKDLNYLFLALKLYSEKQLISNELFISIEQYLRFMSLNRTLDGFFKFFSFYSEFDADFIGKFIGFVEKNNLFHSFFHFSTMDEFNNTLYYFLDRFFKIDKGIYHYQNKNFLEQTKNIMTNCEKNEIINFSYDFYTYYKDYIFNFLNIYHYFDKNKKMIDLVFHKTAHLMKLRKDTRALNLINSLNISSLSEYHLFRYYLIRGNLYNFMKSYENAWECYKTILRKKMGDIYVRETLLLKIFYIKGYQGQYEEAQTILDDIMSGTNLGGSYQLYIKLGYGSILFYQRKYEEAFHYFRFLSSQKIPDFSDNLFDMNIYEENGSSFNFNADKRNFHIKLYRNMGTSALYLQYYNDAVNSFKEALNLAKLMNDYLQIGILYNSIGLCFKKIGFNSRAYYYYQKALDIFRELNSETRISMTSNNLCSLLIGYKSWGRALEYLDISFVIKKKYSETRQLAVAYINYGIIHYFLDHYEIAYDFVHKAIDGFSTTNDFDNLSIAMIFKILVEIEFLYQGKSQEKYQKIIVKFEKDFNALDDILLQGKNKYYTILSYALKLYYYKKVGFEEKYITYKDLVEANISDVYDQEIKSIIDQIILKT